MSRLRLALLALVAAAVLLAVGVLATREGGDDRAAAPVTTTASRAPAPRASPRLAAVGKPIGITEFNAGLLGTGPVPAAAAPFRAALVALRPRYLRVVVNWAGLQPDPAQPARLDGPSDGCVRGIGPCVPDTGVRAQLQAARARGWEVVVVITGVPTWAAKAPSGCERTDAEPRMRPITPQGLVAYGALLDQVDRLGRGLGLAMGWWSPWNEPNHPAFVSPQRAACATSSPSLSPAVYTAFVRVAQRVLGPRGASFVLGEEAGFRRPSPRSTGVGEFVRALPDDVACAASAWSQHEYASPDDEAQAPFSRDAVADAEAALARRPCTRDVPLWVTETGVGGAKSGADRTTTDAALATQCERMAARLQRWRTDPRVAAVFAYTFREDPVYPVGLADAALTRLYPTYWLWRTGRCPAS